MKRCPFCAEEIQEAAIKCKHCNEMLGSHNPPTIPRPKFRIEAFSLICSVVVVVLIELCRGDIPTRISEGTHAAMPGPYLRAIGAFIGLCLSGLLVSYIAFRSSGRSQRIATWAYIVFVLIIGGLNIVALIKHS